MHEPDVFETVVEEGNGERPSCHTLSSGIYTLVILRSFWYLNLGSDLGFSIVLLDTSEEKCTSGFVLCNCSGERG